MITLMLLLTALLAYCLGNLNGSILVSRRCYRKDVRACGSHSASLSNFYRTFGLRSALIAAAVDVVKTVAAVLLGWLLLSFVGYGASGRVLAAFCVLLGHVYPVLFQLRGGRGVLCLGVAVLIVSWKLGVVFWMFYAIVLLFTRYTALSALIASVSYPLGVWITGMGGAEGVVALFCFIVILLRHRGSIRRLMQKREPKLKLNNNVMKRLEDDV